ncbi:GAF domain-containing sensor histidine kinase [Halobaculum sp. EA56]|uniref:sensor histidine kinase n=1 Tax=Halobaculum sp. EA56 TaxID=3421648 RepID=UPI003EBCFA1A
MARPPAAGSRDEALLAIREASRRMARADDTDGVVAEFVDTCAGTLGVELAAVRGYDPRRDALGVVAATDAAEPHLDDWDDHRRGDDRSPAWRAFETGDPEYVAEPESGTGAESVAYALYLPLGVHGVAALATLDPDGFDDRTRYLLGTLASDTTAALDAVADRRRLRGLHEATRTMQAADDPEAIAAAAVDATDDVLDIPYSGARLREDADGDRIPMVAVSDAAAEDIGTGGGEAGERLAREVLDRGEPVVETDIDDSGTRPSAPPFGVRSGYPLGDHGVLSVALPEGMTLDGRRRELARVLADNAAAALDRAERTTRLREQASTIAARDERLEEFAEVVSHDLRNPLNVAAGRVDLAAEKVDDPDVASDLATASEALGRVADVVEDARALAVGERVDDAEPVSLEAVATAAWGGVETGGAELTVEADGDVTADRGLLARLLENLFRNAVEHAGDAPRVLVVGTADGFAVEDDGPGVPADERGAVFRVGYSGADGTGLGLGIVARVAEAHGWSVRIEDGERLGGARFVVET